MARDGNVLVRILGDVSDLSRKLRAGETDVKGFARGSKDAIKGTLDDAITSVTGRFGRLGDEAGKGLSKITSGAMDAGGALGTGLAGGAAIATAGIVALAVKGVQSMVDLADKVRRVQQVTGATAEESSALVAVMDDMKIGAEQGAAAMFRLSRNVDQNKEAMAANGIAIAENAQGGTDLTETLLNVADAYKAAGGGAAGNKILFDAFGRSGAALIPLLQKGREELEAMFAAADAHGEILSQEDLDAAREFELAMDDLGDAVGGLQRSMAGDLVPAFADFAQLMADITDLVNRNTGGADSFFGEIFEIAKETISPVDRLKGALADLRGVTGDSAKEDREAAVQKERLAEEMRIEAEEAQAAEDALMGLVNTTLTGINADLRYADATNRVEDSLAEVNRLTQEGKANTEEYGRAVTDAAQDILGQAAASAALAGETASASEKATIQRNELIKVAETLAPGSPLRVQLEEYIARLGAIPTAIETNVRIRSAANAEELERIFRQNGVPVFDDGGVVPGPTGRPTLIQAHAGETVLPTHKPNFEMGAGMVQHNTFNISGANKDGAEIGHDILWALGRF